ncbi:MAG: DNA repair protein RecO [Firmicutes bacterium]|nr:DNA repair protein RecO [Bacillota bacterium]
MAELRCHAVVLRVRSLGEADKMVTLLTREVGIVTAVARGSRKTKSKFSALVEPLTLGRFLLHQGRTLYTFIQGERIKSYAKLNSDLERLAYAQYFCELCERTLLEVRPADAMFMLLLTALEALEQDKDPARVARCFEISLLDELGIRPALEGCRSCGSTSGSYRFDPTEGILLCATCPHPVESYPVSAPTVATTKRLLEFGFHKLSVCVIPKAVGQEIHRISMDMLTHSLGVTNLKSLDFLLKTGFI